MSVVTRAAAAAAADAIRVETAPRANTAQRVGGLLRDMIDSLGFDLPFRATLHVDPTFTGTERGTESAPFSTYVSAIAAAPATGAIIKQAPGTTFSGNVTLPTSGVWELACENGSRAIIDGNVVISAVVQTKFRLTNMTVTGSLTGLTSNPTANAANFVVLTNSSVASSNLTQSVNGFWFVLLNGVVTNFFAAGGFVAGAINVAGQLFADNWFFGGSVTTNSIGNCENCRFVGGGSALITLSGGGALTITRSVFTSPPQFVGGAVSVDGFTYSKAAGFVLTSGATLTLISAVNPAQITAGGGVNGNYMGMVGGFWGPVPGPAIVPGTWIETAAQDHRTTNATTANQVIGGFSNFGGALVGVDGAGKGEVVVTVNDVSDSADIETHVIGFTWKVVGGATIIASSTALYGVSTRGAASVVASGAGFNVQVTPSLSTLFRWDCAVKILGRPKP